MTKITINRELQSLSQSLELLKLLNQIPKILILALILVTI